MLRSGHDGSPYITDEGNFIFDCHYGEIVDPAALARTIKSMTGVVEHGLFLGLASLAIIAGPSGARINSVGAGAKDRSSVRVKRRDGVPSGKRTARRGRERGAVSWKRFRSMPAILPLGIIDENIGKLRVPNNFVGAIGRPGIDDLRKGLVHPREQNQKLCATGAQLILRHSVRAGCPCR